MILFLSHSGGHRDNPDWWIVEPRNDPERLGQQVRSLLNIGRRVQKVVLHPVGGEILELTDLPEAMQENALAFLEFVEPSE